jgi:hypothetical protein
MPELSPGRYGLDWKAPEMGLYRLQQGDLVRVVAVGPSAPREYTETIATGEGLAPIVAPMQGGILRLEEGTPSLRLVREGRPAAGRGWIGINPRDAFVTEDLRVAALFPVWLLLALAAGLAVGAWLVEGRAVRRRAE